MSMNARQRIDAEVQDIIHAAEAVIRYANQIPEMDLNESEAARLAVAEALLLDVLRGTADLMAIKTHFRKWSKQEVLI